jgi:hypothetical protein
MAIVVMALVLFPVVFASLGIIDCISHGVSIRWPGLLLASAIACPAICWLYFARRVSE